MYKVFVLLVAAVATVAARKPYVSANAHKSIMHNFQLAQIEQDRIRETHGL
jgi:hypothetical protein